MPIEFPCPSCSKTLRVPDDAAGKHAKCPSCDAIAVVPAGAQWTFADPAASAAAGAGQAGPPSKGNPFDSGAAINPYAAPKYAYEPKPVVTVGGAISPRPVGADEILTFAWDVWKRNLGLLVGITLVAGIINIAVSAPFLIMEANLRENGDPLAAAWINLIGNIVSNLIQIFLGIGEAQIALKLARGQHAEFGDLFRGGPRFLPVLGISILLGLAIFVGALACVIPGIIVALMFWPAYYVVVDERASVFDSFSVAYKITEGNYLTTFVLWLASVGVILLGLLALCIGVLFAAPLVAMFWAAAYLLMSGQLNSPAQNLPEFKGA